MFFYQSIASAVTPRKVFNPVYDPATVMACGTAIPKKVWPEVGVDVLVGLFTSRSTSAGRATVVVGSLIANGLLYASEVDENCWLEVKIVEVALSEQSVDEEVNPGHMAEPSTSWSIPVLPMFNIVVVADSVPVLESGASDPYGITAVSRSMNGALISSTDESAAT